MHRLSVRKADLPRMEHTQWQQLVENGIQYSSQVCRSQDNYIK
jgi:hypothetical protein